MDDVLYLYMPIYYETKCGWCQRVFKPRLEGNDPAYCCHECGVNAQPHKAKTVIRNSTGSNAS